MSKIILGKNIVNGFFSVQHGDIYRLKDGNDAIVAAAGGGFWQLRHITDEGKADYTKPPVPEWEAIDGQSAMVHMINREYFLAN
jgi:hypothetical protein